ncbi:hypothetical protein CKO31_12905 [Thiohalocapsa halophila]|uniref:DUF805 domain-containing protein n=1 Tax=Thiohalocapsa halophila TaxID=69359 RepID=A0ABS1CI77_9GAMM|nr:hypothetical protein [Thiohalocapsa halophila]MBK1631626.1 hypothetical protein [Thiohalocapsa halophila]
MFYAVDEVERRRGKAPHELAMINLLLFNLLIGVALLAGSMAEPDSLIHRLKWLAVAVPLVASLAVMVLSWVRAARAKAQGTWFAAAHWQLSARRWRLLLAAYVLSAGVVSLAFVGCDGDTAAFEARIAELPPAMQAMERSKAASQDMGAAIWARIGVVPLLLTVMTLIMLESGALYQAGRGEVPDGVAERLPPPPDLPGYASPAERDAAMAGDQARG